MLFSHPGMLCGRSGKARLVIYLFIHAFIYQGQCTIINVLSPVVKLVNRAIVQLVLTFRKVPLTDYNRLDYNSTCLATLWNVKVDLSVKE